MSVLLAIFSGFVMNRQDSFVHTSGFYYLRLLLVDWDTTSGDEDGH